MHDECHVSEIGVTVVRDCRATGTPMSTDMTRSSCCSNSGQEEVAGDAVSDKVNNLPPPRTTDELRPIGATGSGDFACDPAGPPMNTPTATNMAGSVTATIDLVRRRQRNRWGVLQDRFNEMMPPSATTNPLRVASFNDVARLLDRAAFDPEWVGHDEMYQRARERVDSFL